MVVPDDEMLSLRSYIGDRYVAGNVVAPDLNPARPNEVVAEVHLAEPATARDAVAAARASFPGWRALPPPARGEILRKAADLLDERADVIGSDLSREEGKTVAEGIGETHRAAAIFRYYAGQTLEADGEIYPSASPSTFLYARRQPLGVVLVISPWNFPIAIPAWKIAPALAYGNSVVFKPAELVPLTAFHLVQALVDSGIPPGVLNLVLGKSSIVGDQLVNNDAVDAITFTGSNAVGRTIQLKATQRGARVQLELGGKNPAVVAADASLPHAAEQVAKGAFLSAGQKCTATSRVIVEASVLREFSEELVRVANHWRLGDPSEAETRVGPLVSGERLAAVLGFVENGRAAGARFLAGGDRANGLGGGYYMQLTVLTDVDPDAALAQEEIFGPVVVLLSASGYEEAVALANKTRFGLSASLFTRDLGKAMRFANDMQAGVVKINQETAGIEFQAPFGGMKASSNGWREQGKVARDFFTEWKTVYMDAPPPR
jgi:alpha-ketoglutaric semialdehyde dehydrogenase